MPWEHERNLRSLSPHGIKEAEGHGMRGVHDPHCVGGPEMPQGILGTPLNVRPNDRGEPGRGPVMHDPSARRPVDEPTSMETPHTASPHKYAPATERASVVVTPRSRP